MEWGQPLGGLVRTSPVRLVGSLSQEGGVKTGEAAGAQEARPLAQRKTQGARSSQLAVRQKHSARGQGCRPP